MDEIEAKGSLTIVIEGTEYVIEKEDLLIEAAQKEEAIKFFDHQYIIIFQQIV